MKKILFIFLAITFHISTSAQEILTISGTVVNAKGKPIPAASVFIDGSKKGTATDNNGNFTFPGLSAGTYRLVVNIIGYNSVRQNVIIQDKSANLNIAMTEKQIALREVIIGKNSSREKFLKIFIKNFIGTSENAMACKILNTDILDFSTQNTLIEAVSNDFLIIENNNLGYRIKYLLRNFRYNKSTAVTSYDGECIFENLDGSEAQKQIWKTNRKLAYQGSLMHYLRSLFSNTTYEEGFFTFFITNNSIPAKFSTIPVTEEQITKKIDSNFMMLKFPNRLYVVNRNGRTVIGKKYKVDENTSVYTTKDGSIMRLYLDKAIFDAKGSYVDYRSFLIQGFWGRKRIGDQLPFEYMPDSDN